MSGTVCAFFWFMMCIEHVYYTWSGKDFGSSERPCSGILIAVHDDDDDDDDVDVDDVACLRQ